MPVDEIIDTQNFIDKTVGQAEIIGLTIPDPDLKWNEERGHYDFGEMDWDEFWNVVNGNGPCNKQRLAHHKKAHDEGDHAKSEKLLNEALALLNN